MAEGALVAVLQAHHVGGVEAGDRVALQVLVLGLDAFFLGLFLALEVFLVAQLGDDRFALVGLLDFGAGAVEVVLGQQVQGHLRGQHDFFVVVAFVAANLVVDQVAAELAQVLVGVELDRLFPLQHDAVGRAPGVLAALEVALGAQQLALLEVVEQVFLLALVVTFQQGQGGIDVAGGQLLVGFLQFAVVAAEYRAAGELHGGDQGRQG